MLRWLTITVIIGVCSAVWAFQTAEPFKPGKLPPAELSALQPGLTLRVYGKPTDKEPLDARRVRVAALHVPADSAPSPFLSPGPFHAKLSGYIKNTLKGSFLFRLVGTGAVILKINEKIVLNHPDAAKAKDKTVEVELAKNYNRVEIDYVSPPQGDATIRLYWAGEKFGFEPVSTEVLFSRGDEADLVKQTALREGRLLYADHHCAACHALPGKLTAQNIKMPEMTSNAPRLDVAGQRFQVDWVAAWALNPRGLRPEATMPNTLHGSEAPTQAADIAAYLITLKSDKPLAPLGKDSKTSEGEAIFKKLGCVSCHRLSDPKEQDELGRLSLYFVGAKYAQHALAHFLKEPHKRYAWTRMPDFRLSDAEAGHLEAYLRAEAKGKFEAKPKGDAARGAMLFRSAGCVNCHQTAPDAVQPGFFSVKIQAPDKGCLADKEPGKAPDFALKPAQRSALRAFLQTDGTSLTRDTPAEFAQRQVQQLQCTSCHRRDGASTRWHQVLEEEGKVPENLPSLTWIGEKLKPDWSLKLLTGESDHRARPWLKARMPAFPARAATLAVGLSHEHGFGVLEDDRPPVNAKLAEIGEKLIPQAGGFNCINCHGIGKQPPIAPFEAPGINLVDAALRLRHEYYQRWMLDPSRVDVTMRMPVFAMEGKTQIRDVFDGDAHRQFEAIWQYIQTLPGKQK